MRSPPTHRECRGPVYHCPTLGPSGMHIHANPDPRAGRVRKVSKTFNKKHCFLCVFFPGGACGAAGGSFYIEKHLCRFVSSRCFPGLCGVGSGLVLPCPARRLTARVPVRERIRLNQKITVKTDFLRRPNPLPPLYPGRTSPTSGRVSVRHKHPPPGGRDSPRESGKVGMALARTRARCVEHTPAPSI